MSDQTGLARRALLLGTLASGGSAIAASAAAPTGLTTGMLVVPDVTFAGYLIALDRKLFAAEGITAELVTGGPNSPPMLTLLSAGKVDVAIANWFTVLDAAAKGNDFVVVAANFPRNPTCLMSLPARPIRVAADILDKKLLLQYKYYTETIDMILAYNHLPRRYTIGPAGLSVDTLLAGDGDGYFAYVTRSPVNLDFRGLQRDKDFIVTPLSGMGYDLPDGLYVVKRSLLETNRGAVVGYLRALVRGNLLNEQDPGLGVDLTVNKYSVDAGLNPKIQDLTARAYLGLSRVADGKGPLWFSPRQVDRMYELAGISGRVGLPDRDKVIDMAPLEEALRSL